MVVQHISMSLGVKLVAHFGSDPKIWPFLKLVGFPVTQYHSYAVSKAGESCGRHFKTYIQSNSKGFEHLCPSEMLEKWVFWFFSDKKLFFLFPKQLRSVQPKEPVGVTILIRLF